MDEPEGIYLVSGATLDDEPVGPLFLPAADAHDVARKTIAGIGGTVGILRDGEAGWVEVARYTDTGVHSRGVGGGLVTWAVIAVDEDEPDWADVVEVRRPFAGLRRRRR
jgi:hypothetical protein